MRDPGEGSCCGAELPVLPALDQQPRTSNLAHTGFAHTPHRAPNKGPEPEGALTPGKGAESLRFRVTPDWPPFLCPGPTHSLKVGGTFPRGDQSVMERSVGRLRSMHSKMLLDIEKVQIHFGGSVKASSQMIHELLHAHCLGSPCYRR